MRNDPYRDHAEVRGVPLVENPGRIAQTTAVCKICAFPAGGCGVIPVLGIRT